MDAPQSSPREVIRLLSSIRRGDRDAEAHAIKLVYREPRRRAGRYMRWERPGHTVQPTALVHEADLRLTRRGQLEKVSLDAATVDCASQARIVRTVERDWSAPRAWLHSQRDGGKP